VTEPTGIPVHSRLKIALVHNWPGARNSEWELIGRFRNALTQLQHQVHVVDPMGTPLDDDAGRLPRTHTQDEFDIVLNLHFLNPKFLYGISYVVNWNPLEFIFDDPNTGAPTATMVLPYLVDCLRTHDRVLSGGSKRVDQYAMAARAGSRIPALEAASLDLYPTIEAHELQPLGVDGSSFKVFYIGLNWERMSSDAGRRVRHDGLFQILDRSRRFEFYGLRAQSGVPLWSGIESYRGELPFDGGRSIIEQSRACGVTLILSSPQHMASSLVSSRIFQAAAAGVIVLSDRNSFVEQHFGDSVLYFEHGDTPAETAANILDQVEWIENNWEAASERAACCNAIMRERFALDVQMERLCKQAILDVSIVKAQREERQIHRVRVMYRVTPGSYIEFQRFLRNIECQNHHNVELVVLSDQADISELRALLTDTELTRKISLRTQGTTLGEVLIEPSECEYTVVYSEGFVWTPDHLSGLIQCVRANARIAYVPLFVDYQGLRSQSDTTQFFAMGMPGGFRPIGLRDIARFEMGQFPTGNILIPRDSVDSCGEAGRGAIARFDSGCVYMLVYLCYQAGAQLPDLVPRITSRLVRDEPRVRDQYDTYEPSSGEPSTRDRDSRHRDRNAFLALGRYVDHRGITDFHERASTWEHERDQQREVVESSMTEGRVPAVPGNSGQDKQHVVATRRASPLHYAFAIFRRGRRWLTSRL
jgi:hypothetical protein